MKKALSLIGLLCILLAFVIPIFMGPLSIFETPFWDSTPYSKTNPIVGGDPGENPVRVNHWEPLQSFIVDGTYKLNRIEVYAQMCNYLPDELASMTFPEGELRAQLYNWTPADGGEFKLPGDRNIATYHYDITNEMKDPRYISLTLNVAEGPTVSPDPTTTHSIAFQFYGDATEYYDICIYRSLKDHLSGRGYIYSEVGGSSVNDWNPMPTGEGQDVAMRLYGTEIQVPDPNGNGEEEETEDKKLTEQVKDNIARVPVLTAFLFALGGLLIIIGMKVVPMSLMGWIILLILFTILFAVWYFWLVWAWLGVFA